MKNSNVRAAFLVMFAVFASNAPAAFTKGRGFAVQGGLKTWRVRLASRSFARRTRSTFAVHAVLAILFIGVWFKHLTHESLAKIQR
jgi:hypothetical protein